MIATKSHLLQSDETCNVHDLMPLNYAWARTRPALFEDYGDSLMPISAEPCGQLVRIEREEVLRDGTRVQYLRCGHQRRILPPPPKVEKPRSRMFNRLLPHQKAYVEFAENASLRCMNNDGMGTGKTIQASIVLRENAAAFTANYSKYVLVVVPTGGIYQWREELLKWIDVNSFTTFEEFSLMPQVILVNGQVLSPMSKVIICPWSKLSDDRLYDQIAAVGLGGLIVDEAHFFKNRNSQRTKALQKFVKLAGPKAPIQFLTGTPVENRIFDLEVALNILDPQYFSSWQVLKRMCTQSAEGKSLTLAPRWREHFFDRVRPYVIGRAKHELDIPFPPKEVHKIWVDPQEHAANEDFARAYNRTLDELEEILASPGITAQIVIGIMQQLRHHTAKLKLLSAAIWIQDFFTMNPGEKLCVGVHHIAVREALAQLLAHLNPLQMSSEDPKTKDEIEEQFRTDPNSNLLLASIIGAGTGRNFQFCKNAMILERQWNRSREDQFIDRFHRIIELPDGSIKSQFDESDTVRVWIMQGLNTFDEFFDPLVHLKGAIADSADESEEEVPDEDLIIHLARRVVEARIKWVAA